MTTDKELINILNDRIDELAEWWIEEHAKIGILQIQYEHLTGKELDDREWEALHAEWKAQIESFEGLQLATINPKED